MLRGWRRGWAYAWAAPVSAAGLVLALLAWLGGAQWRWVEGQLEVAGGVAGALRLRWLGRCPGICDIDAITLGHVILGRDHPTLAHWRRHEQVHVRQYERWGVWMPMLYAGHSLVLALRGQDAYGNNAFEVAARDRAQQ